MYLRLLSAALFATCLLAEAPAGRWEGTIVYGSLKVPFTIYFEGDGKTFRGSFANGDSRVASTSGSFENGKLSLAFELSGRMEASLNGGEMTGSFARGGKMQPFTAGAYCTCAYEGDAGPDISGDWDVPDTEWHVTIRRKAEDTLVRLSRGADVIDSLIGRF